MPIISILDNWLFRWSIDYSIDYENDRFESFAISYIFIFRPFWVFNCFSRWDGFVACEGFVFNLTTFRENHFIRDEPFYTVRDDYYDYPYWRDFPMTWDTLFRRIFIA